MKTYGIGTKIYFDSFDGMLKGIVTDIYSGDFGQVIEFKVTSKTSKTFLCGEILTSSNLHVFPRECYHKIGYFRFYTTPFKFEKG